MIANTPESSRFRPESTLYRPKQQHFRGSLGRFATGVAVVTFETAATELGEPGQRHGITVNSFTSVSMDPPLVLVSIALTTTSHNLLEGRPFTVNILGAEQQALAMHFAGKPTPGYEPKWVDHDVAPRLSGVLSYFHCTPWAVYGGGDHTLFLGEVQEFDYRSGDALGFVNGMFTPIPQFVLGHEELL